STSIRDVQLLGTKVTRRVELMRLKFVSGTVAPGAEICGNTRAQIRGDYVDAEGAIVFAKGVRDGPRRHRLEASRRFLLERPGQEGGQGQEPGISETMRRGSTSRCAALRTHLPDARSRACRFGPFGDQLIGQRSVAEPVKF